MRALHLLVLLMQIYCTCVAAQQVHIKLEQGDLTGQKVFPDGSRTAVYAFLGIPYAQPPINDLRFAAPQAHRGWNRTLHAVSMQPICPQLSNTIYDESTDNNIGPIEPRDEDCLYLNIWVSESGIRYGNLPVLVVITGEDMSYDWQRNRISGLDFASDNVIVVSVQYRSNIFGWISLRSDVLPGNYGLQDVQLALDWLNDNIQRFGGNANEITLLGHGSSGAPIALATFATTPQYISKLILMSAGDVPYTIGTGHELRVLETSRVLLQKLGCYFERQHEQIIHCLRRKSVSDLLHAYESVYNHGNSSLNLGVMLPYELHELLSNHTMVGSWPPLLLGIASNEGAFLQDYWLHLAHEGYDTLRAYINYTVVPNILKRLPGLSDLEALEKTLSWRFFAEATPGDVLQLLTAMQRLISETTYEAPFYALLNQLYNNNNNATYAYVLHYTQAMDIRGKVNYFGGASHTADLPLLFGPSLFQQIARRRFSAEEERLCQKLRKSFMSFVKTGHPTSERVYDAWLPYTQANPFIYNLGEDKKHSEDLALLQQNKAQIEKLIFGDSPAAATSHARSSGMEYKNLYQVANTGSQRAKFALAANALNQQQDSGYARHLKRVYGFWYELLPMHIGADVYEGYNALGRRDRLLDATVEAKRYRQGFFAMLFFVCLLLACLCLCLYLLRRDPLRTSSACHGSGCFRL